MRKIIVGILLAGGASPAQACDYQYPVSESHSMLYRVDKLGQPQGLMVTMAQQLGQLSSCRLSPLPIPLARRNAMFGNGQLLMQMGVQEGSQAMLRGADFVPLLRLQVRLLTLVSEHSTANQLLQHADLRIGMLNGVYLSADFTALLQRYGALQRIEYSNDRNSLLRKLEQGRVQAVYDGASWVDVFVASSGQRLQRLVFEPALYIRVGTYLSHRMPKPDRDRLAAGLRRLAKDERLLNEIRKGMRVPASDILPVLPDQ